MRPRLKKIKPISQICIFLCTLFLLTSHLEVPGLYNFDQSFKQDLENPLPENSEGETDGDNKDSEAEEKDVFYPQFEFQVKLNQLSSQLYEDPILGKSLIYLEYISPPPKG